MSEKKSQTDPMNERFAEVMVILSRVGLIALVICGFLWLFNCDPYITRNLALADCGEPAALFWKQGVGAQIGGYAWFLTKLKYTDCLTMFAVVLLAATPLISMLVTIPRCSRKIYGCFMAVIVIELAFAVIKPLIMKGGVL